MRLPFIAPSAVLPGPADSGASSEMEFHSPQASQRPDHFLWTAPQAEQMNWVTGLAMGQA